MEILRHAHGRLHWRDGHAPPPAHPRFDSPHDTEAHYCVKRDTAWSGYRGHVTESCDEERTELVVHVATTHSTVQDVEMAPIIHDDLAKRELPPGEHVVDSGYVTPAHIERAARAHGITPLGAVVRDNSRRAKDSSGIAESAFPADWDRQQATYPHGTVSRQRRPLRISGHDYIQVKFATADCLDKPVRPQCTTSGTRPRALALRLTRELHEIQMRNRLDQTATKWQRRYAIRAGIEATLPAERPRPRPAPLPPSRSGHFRALCTATA
ncbi:transposase [Streptomyces sp. NPDC093228]|uniref:transposase n=1 Tax=Streptomyces sp. NPDC093228 TaxID=3155070 RepID=UPI00341CBB5B